MFTWKRHWMCYTSKRNQLWLFDKSLPSRHPNPAHTQPQLAIKRTHRINTKKKKLSKYLDKRTDYANEGLVRSISEHRQRACVFPLGNFLFRQSNRSRVHNSQSSGGHNSWRYNWHQKSTHTMRVHGFVEDRVERESTQTGSWKSSCLWCSGLCDVCM